MNWRFSLQHSSLNAGNWFEVEEPVGWDEAEITLKRDPKWHGINAAYTLPVQFLGTGRNSLRAVYDAVGIDTAVLCRIEAHTPDGDFQTLFEGRINLGDCQFKYEDGLQLADVNIEEDGNLQRMLSRLETQVDLRSLRSIDAASDDLPAYTYAPYDLELLPITYILRTLERYAGAGHAYPGLGSVLSNSVYTVHLTEAPYLTELDEIGGAEPSSSGDQVTSASNYNLLNACFRCPATPLSGNYQVRVKAQYVFSVLGTPHSFKPVLYYKVKNGADWSGGGTAVLAWTQARTTATTGGPVFSYAINVDVTLTVPMVVLNYLMFAFGLAGDDGNNLTLGTGVLAGLSLVSWVVDIREETEEDSTLCKAVLVNEALARVSESISGRRVTALSDYFGRTASEPLPAPSAANGRAHNLAVTNGLLVRQIDELQDNSGVGTPTPLQMNLKELLEALDACYNIGWTLEDVPGSPSLPTELDGTTTQVLRVEDKRYFYQQGAPVFTMNGIREYQLRPIEAEHYTKIEGGFEKAEVEDVNGLQEFNAKREWQADIAHSEAALGIRCKFVASGYIIEKLRRSNVFSTGTADTTYDADRIFIAVATGSGTHPDGETYAPLVNNERSENFTSLSGDGEGTLLDGNRAYNLRLAPQRNLQRWLPLLFAGKAVNNLKQTYYEGNNSEQFELTDGSFEDGAPARDFPRSILSGVDEWQPYYELEELSCEYPLSWSQYLTIKASNNRYKPIAVTESGEADGSWYIRLIGFRPSQGMAKWQLIRAVIIE